LNALLEWLHDVIRDGSKAAAYAHTTDAGNILNRSAYEQLAMRRAIHPPLTGLGLGRYASRAINNLSPTKATVVPEESSGVHLCGIARSRASAIA
jgi:hypothetical protein